jgi:5-methylcytosine-specific restriction endonuclease McrA
MDESTQTKTCIICGDARPLQEFYKLAKARDGRHPRCRDCFNAARRRRRAMTPADKIAEIEALKTRPAKTCSTCGDTKPRAHFRANKASRDGMTARCKPCEAAWHRAHYLEVRERRLEQSREWYEANKDERLVKTRAWYAANKERAYANSRRWIEENREHHTEWFRRRRALLADVSVGPVDLDALWTGQCGLCDEPMDRNLKHPDPLSKSLDHIHPISRGGLHEQTNLQWAHLICNIRKGARLPESA